MAKRAQIPRFGNWDKDDIPYSVYFDNARKERSGIRNYPNDPKEDCNTSEENETVEDGSSDLERSGIRNYPNDPKEDRDTSEENETVEDGSSDLDRHSDKDSIQIYAATPPEKMSFPGKQQQGIGSFAGLETPLGAPSQGRDEKVFNKTGSIKSFDRSSSLEMKDPKFSRHGAQTQQHQRRPSIPKFCSLTDNNVQYKASTEKGCKDKAGSKINPHDPEETHNAFWFPKGSPGNDCDISPEMPPRLSPGSSRWSSLSVHQNNSGINAGYYYKENYTRRRTPVRSRMPENGNNKMNPRHSSLRDGHRMITSEDRNSTLRSSSTNSSSGRRNTESFRRSNMNQPYHSPFQKSPSAPAFTRWDETSAEDYSDTFNEVKGEKETESIKDRPAPTLPVVPTNNPSNQNSKKQEGLFSRLKASCCLFPNEKE